MPCFRHCHAAAMPMLLCYAADADADAELSACWLSEASRRHAAARQAISAAIGFRQRRRLRHATPRCRYASHY
jgi:hypothetical protein